MPYNIKMGEKCMEFNVNNNSKVIDNSKVAADAKLYKYMDLEKFLSLIVRNQLCFCNQRTLKKIDPYEGAMTKGELIRENFTKEIFNIAKENGRFQYIKIYSQKNKDTLTIDLTKSSEFKIYNDDIYYIDCWHINNYESLAMWKVFSNNKNSIAISTTKKKLIKSLNIVNKKVYLQEVNYEDLSLISDSISFGMNKMYLGTDKTLYIESDILQGFYSVNPLLRKTKYYEYEQELRMYFEDEKNNDITKFINVNLNLMIDEIIISSNCDEWFLNILNDILIKYDFNKKVKFSDIRQNNLSLSEYELNELNKSIYNMKFTKVDS